MMMKHLVAIALLAVATPAFADKQPEKKKACTEAEIAKYKSDGTQQLSDGQDAAALVSYEKAYTCRVDDALLPRMVLAACKSANAKKAQLYYTKCKSGACSPLVERCKMQNINLK